MSRIAWFIGTVTLVATGTYLFVYLYRWEWQRAIFVGILFLAIEVAMATALLVGRLGRHDGHGPSQPRTSDPRVAARIREAAPRPDRFAWLTEDLNRTGIFVTVLLGGGVLASTAAWTLDRLAGHTTSSVLEGALARRLAALAPPDGGLVATDDELVARDAEPGAEQDVRLLLGPTAGWS